MRRGTDLFETRESGMGPNGVIMTSADRKE
jgi:hypothetical protein